MMKSRALRIFSVSLLSLLSLTVAPTTASAIGSGNCISTVTGPTATVTQSGNNCIVIFTAGTGTWTLPSGLSQ